MQPRRRDVDWHCALFIVSLLWLALIAAALVALLFPSTPLKDVNRGPEGVDGSKQWTAHSQPQRVVELFSVRHPHLVYDDLCLLWRRLLDQRSHFS
ncbi:hypothetical protein ABIB66_005997 [Bradyrhizobium sp. F1.13.3]